MTRAFLASAGAGLCLVGASVTVLLAVSALVAVRGWPGIDPENDVEHVTLANPALSDGDASRDESAGAPALTAPIVLGGARDRAARTHGDATRSRRPSARRTGGAPSGAPAPQRISTPGAGSPSGGAPGSGGGSGQERPNLVRTVTSVAGATVRETGDGAGDTTDPVAPGSGGPIKQTTDTVAGVVEQTGQAVSPAVDRATTGAGTAVQSTGQAVDSIAKGDVNGAVENVTGVVGGLLGGKK